MPNPRGAAYHVARSETPAGRLRRRVQPGQPDECWEWPGARDKKGYGVLQYRSGGITRGMKAHRIAWEAVNGPIPDGLCVCHHCDNPPCCNPAHLFLGTYTDNNRDRAAKGRTVCPRGECSRFAKLTVEQVQELRRLRAEGWKLKHLASRYGVTETAVSLIARGKAWRHAA
jgi:hypothetical protein